MASTRPDRTGDRWDDRPASSHAIVSRPQVPTRDMTRSDSSCETHCTCIPLDYSLLGYPDRTAFALADCSGDEGNASEMDVPWATCLSTIPARQCRRTVGGSVDRRVQLAVDSITGTCSRVLEDYPDGVSVPVTPWRDRQSRWIVRSTPLSGTCPSTVMRSGAGPDKVGPWPPFDALKYNRAFRMECKRPDAGRIRRRAIRCP